MVSASSAGDLILNQRRSSSVTAKMTDTDSAGEGLGIGPSQPLCTNVCAGLQLLR